MKILVTGGTGFVGRRLCDRLVGDGHEVTVVTRRAPGTGSVEGRLRHLQADPTEAGPWQEAVAGQDAVVNLAGSSIFGRWSESGKSRLRSSRLDTTRNLVDAIDPDRGTATTLLSASAVGYYGFHEDETLTESDPPGDDFLAALSRDWEEEADRAREKGARVVLARIGIVLGRDGGALKQMALPFRLFAGGRTGDGRQWLSWIHMKDIVEAFVFLLEHEGLSGPFNMTAPEPARNSDFARILGRILRRPAWLPVPAAALKLALGELGDVLLKGQRVLPGRLMKAGFTFKHPTLEEALRDLLKV